MMHHCHRIELGQMVFGENTNNYEEMTEEEIR